MIEARKCEFCHLVFRWPTDDTEEARRFYEGAYEGQQATDIPVSDSELSGLLLSRFQGTPYDKSHRIETVRRFLPQGRLLDFGCSWGYSVAQWRAAGYEAVGFEQARNRAQFGREKLGVEIHDNLAALAAESAGSFDLVYADHVLEHLPGLQEPLQLFSRLLRTDGTLIVFVPNCGGEQARRLGTGWGAFIGEAHTIAFTAAWFLQNLPRHGFAPRCFSTGDHQDLPWTTPCDGEELVCRARRLPECETGTICTKGVPA